MECLRAVLVLVVVLGLSEIPMTTTRTISKSHPIL
jgi:hypothetical protein